MHEGGWIRAVGERVVAAGGRMVGRPGVGGRMRLVGVLAGVALATAATGNGAAAVASESAPQARTTGGPGWEVVPIPSIAGQADLTEVTAFGRSDAWAVGSVREPGGVRTLALHWDGRSWVRVPSPNPGASENWLFGVAGSSPTDVWAAGYFIDTGVRHRTLLLHWDGVRWEVAPSVDAGSLDSQLFGVAAHSPKDAWAVGSATAWPLTGQTLVEHWDGQRWTRVESPNPGTEGLGSNLLDVAASSRHHLWAVGNFDQGDFEMRTLALHGDGRAWTAVPSPTAGDGSLLESVAADSPWDVWAVGQQFLDAQVQPLALRWERSGWRVSPTPSFADVDATFTDVAVRGRRDVWAVGNQGNRSLIARWNGSSWRVVPGVDPGTVASSLAAIAAVPHSRCLWAVGQSTDGERAEPFVERSCTP